MCCPAVAAPRPVARCSMARSPAARKPLRSRPLASRRARRHRDARRYASFARRALWGCRARRLDLCVRQRCGRLCVGWRRQDRRGRPSPPPPQGARVLQRRGAEARGMSLAIDRVRDKSSSADKPTLYKKIRLDIERRILSGEWPPGHRIPFEHELMASYRCSRMTVNKALSELAQADLIERRRRAGTFVRRPKFLSAVLKIADIRAEIGALGRSYGYELM